MQTLKLPEVRVRLTGEVRPPDDMTEAARKSLPPDLFNELMQRIGNRAPTPAELCAQVTRAA